MFKVLEFVKNVSKYLAVIGGALTAVVGVMEANGIGLPDEEKKKIVDEK